MRAGDATAHFSCLCGAIYSCGGDVASIAGGALEQGEQLRGSVTYSCRPNLESQRINNERKRTKFRIIEMIKRVRLIFGNK